jgi:AcrR family transcriptional regulator
MAPPRAQRARRIPPRRKPGHRTRLELDERRSQLLALGLDFFSARSYDEVSIDDFAAAAGVSKGLLYHYFPTKRDFYVATIREASRQLLETTLTDASAPPLDRIRDGLDAYLAYVERHGPAYAALLGGGIGSDPEVAQIVEETRATFVARMLEGIGTAAAAPAPRLRITLRGWIGFVEAAALDWVAHKDVGRAALRDLLVEIFPRLVGGSA